MKLHRTMTKILCVLGCLFLLADTAVFSRAGQTASNPQPGSPVTRQPGQPAQKVPVMDGGAGSCSLELTIFTADGKPVYAATIKVHIAYGFAGIRRLDLEAGTNAEGKVKFIGLPTRVHRPPLEFQASKGPLVGMATYNPDSECEAKHDIVLDMPKPLTSK
jgi:hypothetical protein